MVFIFNKDNCQQYFSKPTIIIAWWKVLFFLLITNELTAWKVSLFEVLLVRIFPHSYWIQFIFLNVAPNSYIKLFITLFHFKLFINRCRCLKLEGNSIRFACFDVLDLHWTSLDEIYFVCFFGEFFLCLIFTI